MDESTRMQERARLRAQLRTLHPDVGGDPVRFQEVLAAYRALSADTRDYTGDVRFAVRTRRGRTLWRACTHPLRSLSRRGRPAPRVR